MTVKLSKKAKIFYVSLSIILGFVIGVSTHFPFHEVHAETAPTVHKVIGLELSKACYQALASHSLTSCPTILGLKKWDNSATWLSGGFGYDKNSVYSRLPSKMSNTYSYYFYLNHTTILVDPPKDLADKIPIIEIYSVLPTFADVHGVDLEAPNGVRTLHKDRFVVDCNSLIAIRYNYQILNDTIHYVESGCKQTNLKTDIEIAAPLTKVDPTSSQAWRNQQWTKQAILCNTVKGFSCNVKDVNSNW